MPTLFEKSGAEGQYRRFKFEILKLAEKSACVVIRSALSRPRKGTVDPDDPRRWQGRGRGGAREGGGRAEWGMILRKPRRARKKNAADRWKCRPLASDVVDAYRSQTDCCRDDDESDRRGQTNLPDCCWPVRPGDPRHTHRQDDRPPAWHLPRLGPPYGPVRVRTLDQCGSRSLAGELAKGFYRTGQAPTCQTWPYSAPVQTDRRSETRPFPKCRADITG